MKPLEFPLLADENIHPGVVAALVAEGKDVRTVFEEGLAGASDTDILRRAFDTGLVAERRGDSVRIRLRATGA